MKTTLLFIFLVIAILFLGGFVYLKQTQKLPLRSPEMQTGEPVAQPEQSAKTVDVTAQNNAFSPDTFTLGQSEALQLRVTAVDREYQFKIQGYDRLSTTFAKGSTRSHLIDKLGVGEYTYTCGSGCKGTITVESEED